MKPRSIISVILFLLLVSVGADAQSASEIDQRYGAVKFYQVRPLSLMLPTYDASGQICRAEIYPNHQPQWKSLEEITYWPFPIPVSGDIQVLEAYQLDLAELRSIFDELAPVSMRQGKGAASLEFEGFGGAYWTTLRYKDVFFRVEVGIRRGGQRLDMSAAEDNMENFLHPPFGEIIAARIEWTDRVCAEPRDSDPGDVDLPIR
jgi:hypothetical protein